MLAGERPDVFSPCVAVDGGEVDAEDCAIIVDPSALHEEVQVALTIRVADVPVDDAVVNDVALELLAEADALPLDAIALAINAQHQEERALRDGPPDHNAREPPDRAIAPMASSRSERGRLGRRCRR